MKKMLIILWTLVLSLLLVNTNVALADEYGTDDMGFTSVEEYDYYRERIPEYIELFSKEFAEWYVNEGLPGPSKDDTSGPVNCNCVEENNYDNNESYDDEDESYDYYDDDESCDYYENDDESYDYENNSYDDDESNSNNITNNKTKTQKQNKKDLKENLKDSKNPYGEIQPDISRDDLPLFIRIPLQIWEKINEFTKWVFPRN